jgi:hypothetical protein
MPAVEYDNSDLEWSVLHHEEPADGEPGADIPGALQCHHVCTYVFQAITLLLQRSCLRVRTASFSRSQTPPADVRPVDAPPRVRSHCRFRNRGTEYVSKSGVKGMSGSTKRQCDRALAPPPPAIEDEDDQDPNGWDYHGDGELGVHVDVRNAVQPYQLVGLSPSVNQSHANRGRIGKAAIDSMTRAHVQ